MFLHITVAGTEIRAFAAKSCQIISSSVGFTKSRAFPVKSCKNCSNPLSHKNIKIQ